VVKHFKDLSGVCLVGDKPGWFTGVYIQVPDIKGRKEWSIVSKVLSVPYENFLLCSDDCFALKDFDSSLPLYYSMPLKNYKGGGNYPERVRNLMSVYPDGLMYDIHQPMVINRENFHKANKLLEWENRDYLTKSSYGNYIGGGVQLDDYKIKTGNTIDITKPFFSTNQLTGRLIDFEVIYPERSDYEKRN
jgi:hypothetical protein